MQYWLRFYGLYNMHVIFTNVEEYRTFGIRCAQKIPWTEEPGGLQSMGSLRVGHDEPLPFTFHFQGLKGMAVHSSVLAWKIPWMEEPGGLQSMGSLRVGHD